MLQLGKIDFDQFWGTMTSTLIVLIGLLAIGGLWVGAFYLTANLDVGWWKWLSFAFEALVAAPVVVGLALLWWGLADKLYKVGEALAIGTGLSLLSAGLGCQVASGLVATS